MRAVNLIPCTVTMVIRSIAMAAKAGNGTRGISR